MKNASIPSKAGAPAARRRRRLPEDLINQLLVAAGEEFREHGYTGTTTAAIARRADITEAQLFRYFQSKAHLAKEAVFKSLNEHTHEFHKPFVNGDAAQNARKGAHRYIAELQSFIDQNMQMLMSLMVAQTHLSDAAVEDSSKTNSLNEYFEFGSSIMTSRVESPKVDPRLMVRISFGTVLASVLFRDWLFPPGMASQEEINDAVADFVLDGINANADPAFDVPD